ncbi:bifunctional DNA primase/polymerase [Thalassoglobus polymorphus]|uniref:DNA primase/polymerase bifunctional N-terminal domain-containing protein n=1 Tax=Thalassoglobus polymorphus TaxID=2527994 RepID=A0A517QQX1_9PLAN|nr:bifunctional DNA primase/polymerase [Thalassoglobus polymorphus]QDT34005.1 hypothetical protein Mal48_32620 [Thalassoglobus polymorphus]
MNDLLEAALNYVDLGYPVFPCAAGGSNPITPRGFHDASLDPEQIERWWTAHPSANIGLPTAGLVVIDVDGATNTWPGEERAMELAAGPMALTPGGGSHRIFRQPPEKGWRCTQSVLAPQVDTRADGGYIVAPPSRRAEGSYRWVPGMELDVSPDQLPEPPAWLVAQLDGPPPGTPTSPDVATGTGLGNKIPSGQRNATLAKLGGAMRRVGMSQEEIVAALLRANADRCVPALTAREVERIAGSIARYEPDQIAVALAENHWDQMYADSGSDEATRFEDPGPTPPQLLRVPGFINSVIDYTLSSAPYPEPVLAFCGALSLQALLAGRKVRDAADNRTNLYLLGLANSGAGKDYPRKVNQRILLEVGMPECLGNSFASGEGIEDRLFTQPSALFQVDELDGLLLKVTQAKDARHEQVVSILLQMYSSASSVYVMRAKAGKERTVIDQPCLCIFGTAVPKHFYEAISPRLMTNGFLARMLILESQKRGRGREANVGPIPEPILEVARWWAEYQPGHAGNLSTWHPVPQLVDADAAALNGFRAFREYADAEYSRAEDGGDPVSMAIWARAYEKARRLSLIYACSANHSAPQIDLPAVTWACEFVEHQTRRMLFMAGSHASESDFDAKRKRLLEILAKWHAQHGDRWMPFWMINRKLPWSRREHEEVRDTLVAQRLIDFGTHQTGGRPGEVYRLVPTGGAAQ